MFSKVDHVIEFRFPYTLANIMLRAGKEMGISADDKTVLHQEIYDCLERLSKTCIVDPEPEEKNTNKKAPQYLTQYQLLLDSAFDNGIINKSNKYDLNNLATRNTIFSDTRFKALEKRVDAIQEEVKINQQNIQTLSDNMTQLQDALKKKARRNAFFGVAKIAFIFFGGAIVDMLSSIVDYSDVTQLASVVLRITPKAFNDLASKGARAITDAMDSQTTQAITEAGCEPNEFINTIVDASQQLKIKKATGIPLLSTPVTPPPLPITPMPAAPTGQHPSATPETKQRRYPHPLQSQKSAPMLLSPTFEKSTTPSVTPTSLASIPENKQDSKPLKMKPTYPSKHTLYNSKNDSGSDTDEDKYPIHSAIKSGMGTEIIAALLRTGEDINQKNEERFSPVKLAAKVGNLELVEFLFSKGAAGNKLKYIALAQTNESHTPSPAPQ